MSSTCLYSLKRQIAEGSWEEIGDNISTCFGFNVNIPNAAIEYACKKLADEFIHESGFMYMAEMDAKCLAGYIKEGGTDVTMKHIVRELYPGLNRARIGQSWQS